MFKNKVIYRLKFFVNRFKQNNGVSEVIGEVLMLLLVTSSFSVFYYNISTISEPIDPPNVTIVGRVEDNCLVFEHQKGDPLRLDTTFTLTMSTGNMTFVVQDYLDEQSQKNGFWDIGESIIYPLSFNISNIRSYFAASLTTVDRESNSLIFIGTLDVYPKTDLKVTMNADNHSPAIGSKVNFTICVANSEHGVPAVDIEILTVLSRNFSYFSNITSRGMYNSDTGIWTIPFLEVGESVCLTITAIVILSTQPTQLAMILDGSGSISSSDWSVMKDGLANSIENSSIFPHDGNVELTVIQFGNNLARCELGPIIVRNDNYAYIGNLIRNIAQIRGYTPISCGIRCAADVLHDIGNFDDTKRQIINLVTDGVANSYWYTGYTGLYQGYDGWSRGEDYCYTGNFSAKSTSSRDGRLTSNDLDSTGATRITVEFEYRVDDTEYGDFYLYFYNGGSYVRIANLADATEDTWRHYTYTTTSSQYFKPNFRIQFRSRCGFGENIWIDEVRIHIDAKELLNDSFESEYWGMNWWNPGLKSSEEATSYLLNTLQMTNDQDEFNALGVGIGGMYGGPDVDWLKTKIVWPQLGHIAPPYIAGWVKTITTWQEFEATITEIFKDYFGISNNNHAKIITAIPSTDPRPGNNEDSIILTPG